MSIAASACATGWKWKWGGGGAVNAAARCIGKGAAHPVAKSVDAVRVVVQPLSSSRRVRGELVFTIVINE